ncbi:MAG: hypothetical protein R3293_05965 [Candidatus Promineifilaceae bacterium]|nr:hypothetical protein [Candidatus Promineifilaceae bacterium]
MKLNVKLFLPVLFLSFLLFIPGVTAQTTAPAIETLHVAFWPDFDEPAVLVLLTGSLPTETTFPAEVTIPLPDGADVNAVARINSEVGMADTEYEINGNTLTLSTPDPQFRVEYYVPYEDDGAWRTYDFIWNSELDVMEFAAEIQQPANASTLLSEPPVATSVTNPSDGLIYHGFSPQSVESGTPVEISFRYNATGTELTAGRREALPELENGIESAGSQVGFGINSNWIYIILGLLLLLIVAIVTWIAATRYAGSKGRISRRTQKPRKPAPRKRAANSGSGKARYCHSCGTKAEAGDRYCRSCGTELKST